MSASFDQSSSLQLFQHDILEIVTLPQRLRRSGISWTTSGLNGDEASSRTIDAIFDGLLCGGYLRQQVQDTLVRIRIPAKKREQLIYSNPFQRILIREFEKEQEDALLKQHQARSAPASAAVGSSSYGAGANDEQQQQQQQRKKKVMEAVENRFAHRVGKVLGIFLKPSLTASIRASASQSGGNSNTILSSGLVVPLEGTNAAAVDVTRAPNSWLIAVQVGEYTETFPLSCVSEEPMREDEHRVWCRTCIRAEVNKGHPSPSSSGGDSRVLLDGEAGLAVRQRLETVRGILGLVKDVEQRGMDTVSGELREKEAALSNLYVGQKRSRDVAGGRFPGGPRDEVDDVQEEGNAVVEEEGDEDGPQDASLLRMKVRSMEVRCQRLERLLVEQEGHLSQWRQRVTQKEAEVRDLVQQVRLREEENEAAVRSYEDKLREEVAQRQRLEKEKDQNLKLHQEQLSDASKKLFKLAELANRYKSLLRSAETPGAQS